MDEAANGGTLQGQDLALVEQVIRRFATFIDPAFEVSVDSAVVSLEQMIIRGTCLVVGGAVLLQGDTPQGPLLPNESSCTWCVTRGGLN
jgi:hypothetical protein